MVLWKIEALIGALAGAVFALFPFSCPGQIAAMPQQSYASDVQLQAKRSPVDFLPDGDRSKPSWKHAKSVEFDHDASGQSHYPQLSTRVASVWTETHIYFFFWCSYDVVEVFLNPQPERVDHYYEFEVAPNNQWVDLEIDKTKEPFNDVSWNSGFEHAARIDAKNHIWTTEMRIPISSMNVGAIHPDTKWRVNFFRAAGKGGDDHRKFLAWSTIPEGKTFHVPTRFGILQLVN